MLTTGHTCAAPGERRRTWRAARQAAEQVRDGNRVGETWREEKERLKTGERGEERQHRQSNEATLHLILHVSQQQHQLHQQHSNTSSTSNNSNTSNTRNNSNTSNSSRSKQSSSTASALVSSACYLTVVSWLTYPILLCGLQHLRFMSTSDNHL